jgi:aryl-alcohol dehydrogenase-like predicted oxidoreductase
LKGLSILMASIDLKLYIPEKLMMQYNKLIKGSPAVSEIGLGAWQLGVDSGWKNINERDAMALVEQALSVGINFFDTAPNYGKGTSEERLGRALKTVDRESIVVNTKFGHNHTGETNYRADNIRTSLEGSLQRLHMDYVDSLIIHNPPFDFLDGTKNDHYEILEKLKDEGKIKAYGASLDTYEEVRMLLETTRSEVIEVFFNILHQDVARAFQLAKEKQVGVIVKIPLDSGWLSGNYDENSVFEDVRKRWSRSDIKTRALLVNRIRDIIGPDNPLPQTSIAFCLAYDAVSTVIPGNTSQSQLAQNLASVTRPISAELRKELEAFYDEEVRHLKLPW